MSDFKAKIRQIRFPLGFRPRPRWEFAALPETPSIFKGPISKGRAMEGKVGKGRGKGWEKGGKRMGGKGMGKGSRFPPIFQSFFTTDAHFEKPGSVTG